MQSTADPPTYRPLSKAVRRLNSDCSELGSKTPSFSTLRAFSGRASRISNGCHKYPVSCLYKQVSAVADEPARHAASRQKCCEQRWMLSVKYHLVRAEAPLTVKTIESEHQTGPSKGA